MSKKLRVPSLQHMARNWCETPKLVQKKLVQLAQHPPTWGYQALFGAVNDMLVLGIPYDQIVEGIRRKVSRENVRDNLLQVLPLIRDHFDKLHHDSVLTVSRASFFAGQGLRIPFEPPLIYIINGEVFLPWFSFWRSNPLSGKKLSLFVTIVDEIQRQNPDLEGARLQILDFSRPSPKDERALRIIDAADVERLPMEEVTAMLEIFAEGYYAALAELEADARAEVSQPAEQDPKQPGLFDT